MVERLAPELKIESYQGEWIKVEPIHCHQRLEKNTLVEKLRPRSPDNKIAETVLKFNPKELDFFFDHEIDHYPGMLEVCAMRQTSLALGHLLYGVPMDYVAIIDWMEIKLYNYGELNVPTFVRSKLISSFSSKHQIILTLEGLMIQEDYPVMKTSGKMITISPFLAKKIRHKKIKLSETGEKAFE